MQFQNPKLYFYLLLFLLKCIYTHEIEHRIISFIGRSNCDKEARKVKMCLCNKIGDQKERVWPKRGDATEGKQDTVSR